MLYIDDTDIEVSAIKEKHWYYLKCRITKKITGQRCANVQCEVCNSTDIRQVNSRSPYFNAIVNFLINQGNLETVITGNPQQIRQMNATFFSSMLPNAEYQQLPQYFASTNEQKQQNYPNIHGLVKDIQSAFDYDWFSGLEPRKKYSAYHLAGKLNKRSCTYCNRTYTTTMVAKNGGKLMRPQFDHWFPKAKFPLLALSFHNLIPSCYTCNSSVKGDLELDPNEHIHPYIDKNQISDFAFGFFYKEELKEITIYIKKSGLSDKAMNTLQRLKIDEMYNAHHDELIDLIKLKQAYSDKYIEKIQQFFPQNKISHSEIYRLLFGTEFNNKDFHKRPLSKFKSDILKQLGMIDRS